LDVVLGWVERVFLATSCGCIAIMLAINIANLVVRNFAGRGIVWVWPWTGVLLIWSVFLTFYVLYRRRLDITVEYFIDRMSENGRRTTRILVDVCGLIMMGVILIEAPQIISRQVGVLDFVGLERYALSIPLIASAFFIAIEMALDIFRVVATPKAPPPSTEAELPRWSL
jgi:TRAP-type C4-dicarboxylate transport system permease small subunit